MTDILKKILKLKRTTSPTIGGPMGYREIGRLLNLTGPGVRRHVEHLQGRCPSCLRALDKAEQSQTETQPK